jgi:3',5'-cyclic AMP phosphodiesterase CpdA
MMSLHGLHIKGGFSFDKASGETHPSVALGAGSVSKVEQQGFLIAQVTDLHIGFHEDNPHELNVRRLNMVIDQLMAMRPKPVALIVSGDLVDKGDVDSYRHMLALVGRWDGPILWAVGNHDDRANFRKVLPALPDDGNGFVQYERDVGELRVIVLDTLDAGRHGGMLCNKRIAWLEERLGEKRRQPTLIVLHHPPVDTGIDWMSALSSERWVRRLKKALAPADQVIGIVAGHVHRNMASNFAGKSLVVTSSTAPPLALDLDAIDPSDPDDRPLILGDAPAYALHYWNGERLLSHFDFAGPRNVLASYDNNLQPMISHFIRERGTG